MSPKPPEVTGKVEFQKITKRVFSEAKRIVAAESVLLSSHVRKQYMTGGTTPDRLAVRTGNLRSSTKPIKIEVHGGTVDGGIGFGTMYAKMHIGPKGQKTTIKPKNSKFLAIPLDAAMTPSGVPKGSPRKGPWGQTFFFRTREGKLILFGKKVVQKGARAGQTRGNIVPLFLLVKQVVVPARVHPEDILAWEKPKMIEAFRKINVAVSAAPGEA